MTTTLNDMKLAYDYMNRHLFDDRLPKRTGEPRTEIELAADMNAVATCAKRGFGFCICFKEACFGDLKEDLSTLVHEMAHVDLWRDTKGGHDAPWRAWMDALGFDTEENGVETAREDGPFAKARDAWMKWRAENPSARPSRPQKTPAPAETEVEIDLVGLPPPELVVRSALTLFGVLGLFVAVMAIAAAMSSGGGRYGGRGYDSYSSRDSDWGYARYDSGDDRW